MCIKSIIFAIMAGTALIVSAKPLTVSSPDNSISLKFDTDKGVAQYSVVRNGKIILNPSRLGIDIKDGVDLSEGFSIAQSSQASHSETWRPIWGEEAEIANNYNELRVTLVQKKLAPGRTLDIVFRVFNDGIGFRYEFPRQKNLGDFTIMNELTEFAFADNHTTWSIPAEGYRFYEALFRELPLDSMGYVSTPVTLRASDGTH
ncbi:MAG: glycoside hydrolase family 97 N-terminal domain-containing protein, partial [Muribaculaceae bacterium]|nr:glycoside hydrolase family 97 N-terminal domain-containing protein [Muribaculaceae bacterium]